ncbi:MAG: helix-turn-helix domain-containing protein, partial [Parabacteroides sp.]|nr:helix-turn-helix domain-containing protein [Parabacteroides sp.]
IKEIALDLDFPNLSFFTKYTKKHLGMTPTQFRSKKDLSQ